MFQVSAAEAQLFREAQDILEPYGVDVFGFVKGMAPVLELVQDQSQRLQAMRDELESVRSTLNERKLVERAKGLLMAHRQLSEGDAHKLLRQTAMNQNRRLVEVAEAVLATADLLPPR